MTISQKIKDLRKKLHLTQEDFAKRINVNPKSVGFWEADKNEPSKSNLLSICNEFGLSPNYFNKEKTIHTSKNGDIINIPVRGEVTASMGTGVEIYNEDKTGTYQIGKKLLRDIGANQQFSEIIFAQGDSMEPTIEGGDSLLVDLSKTEVYDGKIYCVRIANKLYAKRLQLIPPNKVKVISDNKEKYDPFYIDMSKNIDFDFAVIGEVKWWGRVAK